MAEAELSPELRSLLNTARQLPPDLTRQVADYAGFLLSRHGNRAEAEGADEQDAACDEESPEWTPTATQRAVIRDQILSDPSASDHEIARRVRVATHGQCSRGPVKAVRLDMMNRDEIAGKPWGTYTPYSVASGGNRWLPTGHMVSQDEFARRRAAGEFPDFQPQDGSGGGR